MKRIILNLLTVAAAGLLLTAVAQDQPAANNPPPPPDQGGQVPLTGNGEPGDGVGQPDAPAAPDESTPPRAVTAPVVILPGPALAAPAEIVETNFVPPVTGTNVDELRLNFRNAPLEMVLNYLSDAAGFIIVLDTRVNGNVSIISGQPMTRNEAVDLLNSVLNKNGYAAIRNGRTLTIVDKNDAKTRDIPVRSGNKPEDVPKNAEIVTQIIPIRFVAARQLVSDLTSFVSPQATVMANEVANSIVITDTQANIRHLLEIIRAIDDSAEAETEIRVFRLKYASPVDVANALTGVFTGGSSSTRFGSSRSSSASSFGDRGGGPGGFFAAMMEGGRGSHGSSSSSSSNDRVAKAMQVTAVPDLRIQAVIVTASKDMMEQIANMMVTLDVPSTRDQKVFVYHMNNGDPQQTAQVLQNMFQNGSSSRTSAGSVQNSALMQRAQNNTTTTGSASTSGSSGFGSSTSGRSSRGGSSGGF